MMESGIKEKNMGSGNIIIKMVSLFKDSLPLAKNMGRVCLCSRMEQKCKDFGKITI